MSAADLHPDEFLYILTNFVLDNIPITRMPVLMMCWAERNEVLRTIVTVVLVIVMRFDNERFSANDALSLVMQPTCLCIRQFSPVNPFIASLAIWIVLS